MLVLLAGGAYRVWRLVAEDLVAEPVRRWLYRGEWDGEGDPPAGYRSGLGDFVGCPWCLGFWIAVAWWGLWLEWPHGTLVAAAPFTISAVVGAVASWV
jgi:hypothetical protein